MDVRTARLDELHEDPGNARVHGERNLQAIGASLKNFGQVEPLVVQKGTGKVIGGNGRLQAMRAAGVETCDIVEVDLDDAKAAALSLALNRSAELATWDTAALLAQIELCQLGQIELPEIGFDPMELAELRASLKPDGATTEDGPAPDPPAVAFTQPGDLYELGTHRLLAGDATKAEDVQRVMDGQRAILFATDPPYLVDYDGTNHPHGNRDWGQSYGITWDDSSGGPELYDGFIQQAIDLAIEPNAAWYCWHASRRQAMVEAVWEKHGAFVHQQIIWTKNRAVLVRMHYMWGHEPCFFGWIKGNKPPRVTDEYLTTVWPLVVPDGADRPEHPTVKPVEAFAIPMRQHTRPGDVCYEPFAGSGTQIIAAERLGRSCYGLEIAPPYVDVSVKRWHRLTGGRVVRNGEDVTEAFLAATASAAREPVSTEAPA